MKWDDLLNMPINESLTGQTLTDIDCPECGRKIYLDRNIILTSYPSKFYYWCPCGWTGYAPTQWYAKMED